MNEWMALDRHVGGCDTDECAKVGGKKEILK